MEINQLPSGTAPAPLHGRHFPTRWQEFLWRNFAFVPLAKIAEILGCQEKVLHCAAAALGLPEQQEPAEWLTSGYLTIIRNNWHLLNYRQLLQLLSWSPERMAYSLKEEDFLFGKLGGLKPAAEELKYTPLTAEQEQRTLAFREALRRHIPCSEMNYLEPPFAFREKYQPETTFRRLPRQELAFIHSYAASCGDLLADLKVQDPVPENLLARYASLGLNGIWLHAILYLLHPIPGAEKFSCGFEQRLNNLRLLVERCRRHGIGIFLYLNEPRGMPAGFYDAHPDWRGPDTAPPKKNYCNCTTGTPVLAWMEEACRTVFQEVPGLAGAFLITMSENPTTCAAQHRLADCPRCRNRSLPEIIAGVARAAECGIHAASPEARVLLSDWAWNAKGPDPKAEFRKKVIDLLPDNVWFLSISEWGKSIRVGGIDNLVYDYSISQVGPSDEAALAMQYAQQRGLKTAAKIQINNSWELSAVPYLPVPYLLQEHLQNLSALSLNGLMLSWTHGGYPGGNLLLLNHTPEEIAAGLFSPDNAALVCQAWKDFSEAFRDFPFDIITAYTSPVNFGPKALLYPEKTGYKATMIGFPYDDLATWRRIYPEEIFAGQFEKVTLRWQLGLQKLSVLAATISPQEEEAFRELQTLAEAAWCHLRSTFLQICFVRLRDAGQWCALIPVLKEECDLALRLSRLVRRDSRIGFEASNHYYYTLFDLYEKIVNCEDLLAGIRGENTPDPCCSQETGKA